MLNNRDFSAFMPNEAALQKARKYLRQRKGRRSTRRSSASIDGSVTGESVVSRASSVGADPHHLSCALYTCNSQKLDVFLEGINDVIECIPWVSQEWPGAKDSCSAQVCRRLKGRQKVFEGMTTHHAIEQIMLLISIAYLASRLEGNVSILCPASSWEFCNAISYYFQDLDQCLTSALTLASNLPGKPDWLLALKA